MHLSSSKRFDGTRKADNESNVTAADRSVTLDNVVLIDTLGRVRLVNPLDYEEGHRELHIALQVKDHGNPPLTAESYLHIFVNDSDDQTPKFQHKVYTASVIGEKPVIEECHPTRPALFAEDQDPVKKSLVRYSIRDGMPVQPWHWQNFFFLNAETGELCQRETIPRAVYKRGDQTVREGFEGFYNYTLTVESYQIDNRSKSDIATLYVKVIDQNIHRPTFVRRRYKAEIDEFPAVRAGTVLTAVTAEDEDYGKNSLFEYELLSNPAGAFWIDSSSGEIKVTRPRAIDREKNETITFRVRAREISTSEKRFSDPDAVVEVTVLDDNDNKPKFRRPSYRFDVKDSLTVGTAIHKFEERVRADDPDLGENGTIHFSIMGVQTKGGSFSMKDLQRFKIDRDTGVMKLADNLRDLRRKRKFPQYNVMVKAEDQARQPRDRLSSVVRVVVQVTEANDFPPFFERTKQVSYISEAATIGSLITKLKARDEDGDEDVYLKFRIISGNEQGSFRVSDKGYLFTNRPLDRELRSSYRLTLEASDGKHTAEAILTVHVRDTNDHAPVFSQSSYDFTLSEDASANQMIGKVVVTDKDEGPNGKVIFSLSGEHSDLFGIKKSGEIYLRRRSAVLDRETTDRINIQVRAEDLGQPPEQGDATVRIRLLDVNDNRPVFTETRYVTEITEESPGRNRRRKLVQLEDELLAEDADKDVGNRNITYSLRGVGTDVFMIDKRTGRVYIRQTRLVDCEVKCDYKLKVVARDRGGDGLEGTADLVIKIKDINDNKPTLTKNYTFRASPRAKVGSVIGDIDAVDEDVDARNRRVMYVLKDGGYGKFSIDFDSGRLILVDSLTREPQMETYNLAVEVMDTGEPRLSTMGVVRVQVPVNRKPTLGVAQKVVVSEDARVGVRIGRVNVTDSDSLTYRLEQTDSVPFRVSSDGTISTTRKLDREDSEAYTLEIVVTDRGYPINTVTATVDVVVQDVNDNAPVFTFTRYSGEIVEDDASPKRNQIVKMSGEITVTDGDGTEENRGVVLSLRGEGSDKFTIDSDTGIVKVKVPGSIDCEVKCFYAFKLHAQDQKGRGLSGKADILISVQDLNDNSPTFQPNLTFTLNSLTKVGAQIGSVKATDGDKKGPNNVVLHVLTEGGDGKFEVDPYTGSIKLQMPLLDEPRREKYLLHVSAFDFGNPSLSADTTVAINVPLNFEPRVAPKTTFSVEENIPVGSSIGQVAATDKNVERGEDDHLRYFIDEETLAGAGFPFSIDIDTGMISTKAALDRETADGFTFLVYVVDSLVPVYTSSSSVQVEVRDQNDSPPEFTSPEYVMKVLEDDAGHVQQTLQISPSVGVTDIDTPLADIQFSLMGNGSDLFVIDPDTGHIALKRSGTMDSETQQQYNLTVVASDGRFSSEAPLTVIVEDVNDHAPVFQGEITLNVSSPTPVGSVIGQVNAADADVTEQNNDVMYYVIKGGLDKFAVHPESGEVQVVSSLMENPLQDSYSLTVRAADLGRPQKYSDTTVTIHVPINYQPQVPPVTELQVGEDIAPGSVVHTLLVLDPNVDKGDGDKLNFFISEHMSQDIPFEIDRYTGALRTKSVLDRENTDKYSFLVHVTDSKQPVYTASTTVHLTVTDVNDNVPVFAANSYNAKVIEDDATPGKAQVVYLRPPLKVTDEDSSSEQFVYRLLGTGSKLFSIDASSGQITQREAGSLDGDSTSLYNLTVSVDDGRYVSNVSLVVSVEDVNDHAPVMLGGKRVEVDPLSLPGDVAAVMKAEDLDQSDRNKRVSYYLMAGGMDRFRIEENTGEITVASSLTEGTLQDQYDLEIRVVDHGYPQQSTDFTLTLDVPVNFPPRLSDGYSFRVSENVPVGTAAGQVVATDRNVDKGEDERLSYFIGETESPSLPFAIERDTGQLLTMATIDREQHSEYKFSVIVTDSRSPVYTSSSTVTVAIDDENDNAPVFSAQQYGVSFPEDRVFTDDRELILLPKMSAQDLDGGSDQLQFRLEGAGSELFQMNSLTGAIAVRKEAVFDTEQRPYYNLTVVVSDGLHSSAAILDINVDDINDNAPEFSYNTTIYLDPFAPLGSHAGDASAVDGDVTDPNSVVHYHLLGGGLDKFTIHEETGQLTLVSSLMEDPKRSEYNVKVLAFDMGTPQRRTNGVFKIRVPVNYQPHFESLYRLNVKENVTVGSDFGQVKATDKNIELGEDERLNYFIDEKSTQGVDFPFYMNRQSGQLVISCVLDREKKDKYDFMVYATDSKLPVYTASTLVEVTIDDINDNPPQFGAAAYTALIQEDDANPGTQQTLSVTPLVSATDADSIPKDLTYRLEGPGGDLFDLDPVTTRLRQKTAGSLDSDTHQQYNLTLVVSDGEHETAADLLVMVADTNDNAPSFLPTTELRVDPEERVGTVVGRVQAVDRDTSPGNGDIAYYLQGGGLDKFSVHAHTGEITLVGGLLDTPYREEYQLQIRAVDFGQPQMSDSTVLTVTVPLNKPPQVAAQTVFRVDEDKPVGTEIGDVMASDPDGTSHLVYEIRDSDKIGDVMASDPDGTSHLVYEIRDSDMPFQINQSGTISVTMKLDSERRDEYKFTVLVVDAGTPTHTATTTATIYVDGVNDEKPLFSHTMYTALVEENLSLEASLKPIPITPELVVTDGDSVDGGDVVLTLEGEGSEVFTIDRVTHDLKITDPNLIDCERMCEYNLLLIATDDGGHGLQNSANLTITILDVNDNAPTFQHSYNFSVPPDTPVGTVVGVVEATDIDGFEGNNRITYLLTRGGAGKFFVDPVSGELLVSDSLIRAPIQDIYRLSIRAGDSGYPSLFEDTEVSVNVPNNKPALFSEDLTLTVEESTSVGGYVGEVAVTDPDASPLYPVIFSLLDHPDTLHINPTSGEITTVVALDSERQSQYITRVQIEDRGIPTHVMTATVTVNIADVNDNYPQFSSPTGYAVTIEENDADLETAVLTLKPTFVVSDEDRRQSNFVYKLFGQYSEHFEMNEGSGAITVAPDVDIDCERVCEYNLKINVTDEGGVGLTSTAPLQITVEDINDNAPDVTPDVVYSVSPNATVGDVVGKVLAVDLDISDKNHQLTFILTNGGSGKFAVGLHTGIITVADNLTRQPLVDEYRLQFTVRDSGFPSLSTEAIYTVHVPINRRPIFKNTKVAVDVPEDVEIGYIIADVGVDDPDSLTGGISDITYSLVGDQGLFTIDKSTGLITTAAFLDAEHTTSVDMTASVVDAGIPTYTGTTAVHIDIQGVNDNIPTFSSPTGYTAIIREDVGLRSTDPVEIVLTPGLSITDEDGDDVHVHLSGEGAELFAVDQKTHTITLENPDSIDCEHQCRYNLSIIASDIGTPELTSSAELTVQIEDVNEHAPEFARTFVYPVQAAAPVGTLVGYVEATDKDFGERNSDISYILKSGGYDKFAVHSDTGAITVADSLIREPQLKQYDLQVEARDLGYPQRSAETTVMVKVPVNEEPVFAHTMVYNVSEDFTVGDIIGTVKAEDVDLGMGEKQYLAYSIIGGDGVFSVDSRTGDIILFDDLDAESRSSYELKVKAEDHGYPSLTSTGSLIINVDDVNDNPPVFTAPHGYVAMVSEMADVTIMPIVEIVPELSVLDADIEGATDGVWFGLEGFGHSNFRLDPVTGQLTVRENATLDADLQQIYKLKV
ncbi:protocadherin Fat 4-like [Haliotis cracherodii]|uniref:protocadherin Fat 4-like n=1 Tax=Haliotis cracherodii TaxID=6455 RepID=UPI0039E7F898